MFFYCDRIEDGYASLITDDDSVIEIPLSSLPFGIDEGDTVSAHYHNGKLYILDKDDEDRKRRAREVLNIYEKLKNKNDIEMEKKEHEN